MVAPELLPLPDTPQDPEWHPEGDVWTHTLQAVDEAAALVADLDRPRALAVMLGTLCHDLGKPATTRSRTAASARAGTRRPACRPPRSLLDRWNVHSLLGFDVREQVLALVGNHLKPGQLYDERDRVSDGAIRRLAAQVRARPAVPRRARGLPGPAAGPVRAGRDGVVPRQGRARWRSSASRPPPLLQGRDVLALGLAPGPEVGRIVRAVYERQLDGAVTTPRRGAGRSRRPLP